MDRRPARERYCCNGRLAVIRSPSAEPSANAVQRSH
jgi:hypothetical protein